MNRKILIFGLLGVVLGFKVMVSGVMSQSQSPFFGGMLILVASATGLIIAKVVGK
jgi:hypothetical protein